MATGSQLHRKLTSFGVLLLTLSCLSPVFSIYGVGADVLLRAGTGAASMFICGIGVAVVWAVVYAELGSAYPYAGGDYVGVGSILGPWAGIASLTVWAVTVGPTVAFLAKTIATYGIGAPPQVAFQVTLAKAGIDPETDVTWKAVPFDLVGESVNRGDADLAAHLDPWAYSIEKQFNFVKIADTQTGVYKNHTCCVLGANGPFLAANKDALRRLAEANIEVHEYTANHPDEVAQWYFDALKPAGLSVQDLTEILGALVYHDHPIGQPLIDQIRITAEDLKLVKVLEPSTDPKAFAERVTVNLLA